MIPIKLTLSNFMCYRNPPPLDFAGIHTACICGDNGNGKSALIDAITWAVWGKARSKSDADLIYQGQPEMRVDFDFAVGEQTYRIIRRYAKPKGKSGSGQSSLELQINSGTGFRPIPGNTMTETQQKITDTLHMDYDTFVNSAFLRQGHAGEFTTSQPAKRKEVLANILGLSSYDLLEEQAKSLAKNAEDDSLRLSRSIGEAAGELVQKPVYETQLVQAQSDLANIEQAVTGQETSLNQLRQQRDTLKNKDVQREQLSTRIASNRKTLVHLNEQSKRHLVLIGEYEKLIARREAIEEDFRQYEVTKARQDELNRKLTELMALTEKKHGVEKTIEQVGADLQRNMAVWQSRMKELKEKAEKLPLLESELQKVQLQGKNLPAIEQELASQKEHREKLRNRLTEEQANQSRLEKDITEIEEKLGLLAEGGGAKCPLCEQELHTEDRERVRAKYTAEKADKTAIISNIQTDRMKYKAQLDALEKAVTQLDVQLQQARVAVQTQTAILDRQIAEAKEAEAALKEATGKFAETERQLTNKSYALAERQAMTALEKQIAGLAYNAAQHDEVRSRVSSLEQSVEPKRKLDEATTLIFQEKSALAQTEETVKGLQISIEADSQQQQELEQEITVLPELTTRLAQAETEYKGQAEKQKQAQELVWSLKEKLRRCAELELKKKETEQELYRIAEQEKIYRDLVQAFGKNGIQAMLIDLALPEIEIEADKLLAQMTDNRMHVKLETQRPKKAGGVIETLDINISDELGTRSYEMFSGGEAFRINFAIRIALSRLLAHRAGAPLPTLIIDEGFGTQDTTGIEKLREAINSIQNDFDKILVITHIEELKDAFPIRIDVVKTAEGSTFSLS